MAGVHVTVLEGGNMCKHGVAASLLQSHVPQPGVGFEYKGTDAIEFKQRRQGVPGPAAGAECELRG
eukprot:9079013-Alexandrium_andersonii.AAC.1